MALTHTLSLLSLSPTCDKRVYCLDAVGSLRERLAAVLLLHLLVELVEELLEDQGVDVLAQLVEQEPVAQLALAAHGLHLVGR